MSGRRRWLWPLLALAAAVVACALLSVRAIGLGEWALLLGPLALIIVIESARFVARRFLAGYRDPPRE